METATTSNEAKHQRSVYFGVFGLLLGMFLAMLDGLIVGTALPTIVGDLGGLNLLSWVVTAYLLTTAATTPIWGKLGDLYGRKGAFMTAIVIFLVGSVLSGLSQTMGQLIAFRAVQGVGAGGLMVGALSIIGILVPPRDSGRVQSMVGGILPVAFIGGPLVGGFLTDSLSWRWTFYVNVPVGAIALLIVSAGIRLRTERIKARIDYPGAILLTAAILTLTLLASWGGTRYGWASWQIGSLGVVSVLALVAFGYAERRAAEPVIPPRLFGNHNFTLAQILSFLVGAVMLAVTNYLPQYMQFVQDSSPAASGLLLLPLMFGMLGAQLGAGQLISRTGRYRVYPILGGAVLIVGTLALLVLDVDTSTALAAGLTLITGLGIGLLMQSTMLITMNSADGRDMGAASGTVTLVRTIGGSLGIALLGAVYTSRMADSLSQRLGPGVAHRMASGGTELTPALVRQLPDPARAAFQTAVTHGLHGILIGAAILSAIAFATAWLIREVPLRTQNPVRESPAPIPVAAVPAAPAD